MSSNLISAVEDCADHLIVLGRGRLVADTSVRSLRKAASHGRVVLRTVRRAEAMTALANAGATVAVTDRETLTVTGLTAERVAALLAELGVPFSRSPDHGVSLDEAYMELTRDAAEPAHTPREA